MDQLLSGDAWSADEQLPQDRTRGIRQDGRDRRTADQTLRESEQRYRLAARATNDIIWDWDLESDHVTWNEALQTRFGYIAAQVEPSAQWWIDRIHPDDRERVVAHVYKVIGGDVDQFTDEYRFARGDGGYAHIYDRGFVMRASNGQPLRMVGAMQDLTDRKKAEEALLQQEALKRSVELAGFAEAKANEKRWRDTLDLVPHMIWSMHADGTEEYYNHQWLEFTGVQLAPPGAVRRIDLVHPDDLENTISRWRRCVSEGCEYQAEYRLRHRSGDYRWIVSRGRPERDAEGRIVRWYGTVVDIHERKCAELALKDSEQLHRTILEASADCTKVVSLDGRLEFMNSAGCQAMELDSFECVSGKTWSSLWPTEAVKIVERAIKGAKRGRTVRFSACCPTAKGTPKWWDVLVTPMRGEDGRVKRLLSISRDVTADHKLSERLRRASEHDPVTNLYNRRWFNKYLNAAIVHAKVSGTSVGLLLLDLDHFKNVNDTLGHVAGDHVLKTVAQRLKRLLRTGVVARLGGDEFAIILEGASPDDLVALGKSILRRLQRPASFEGRLISGSASIGGALFPKDARSATALLKCADTALYAIKSEGRGGTKFFHKRMREEAHRISAQLAKARTALANNSILPFYQPKVNLASSKIEGFEALLRLKGDGCATEEPDTIAEAFKDYDLASRIGEAMQIAVLRDIRSWLDTGLPFGHVSINAAPAEFLRNDYAEKLLSQMTAAGVPGAHLQVEITEHALIAEASKFVSRALRKLERSGVRVALDDFGTGYSSLAHLREFPVHVLKIDRSFLADVDANPESFAIISAVVDLARNLSIEVVAEGVETEKQVALLASLGCQLAQGYFFAKALPASCATALLT